VAGGTVGVLVGSGTAVEAVGDVGEWLPAVLGGRLRFEQLYVLHSNYRYRKG
jgi:hypothetical protein